MTMIGTKEDQLTRIKAEFDGLACQMQRQRKQNADLPTELNEQRSHLQY